MRRRLVFSIAAIATLAIACRDVSAPGASLRIDTSDTSYVLYGIRGREIPATVTNISSRPIDLAACGGVVISVPERSVGGRWEDQTFAVCYPLDAVRLDPGETLSLDVQVRVVGAFRLRVPLFVDSTRQALSVEASSVFNIL